MFVMLKYVTLQLLGASTALHKVENAARIPY